MLGYATEDPFVLFSITPTSIEDTIKKLLSIYEQGKREKTISELLSFYNAEITLYFSNYSEKLIDDLNSKFGKEKYGNIKEKTDEAASALISFEMEHKEKTETKYVNFTLKNMLDYVI